MKKENRVLIGVIFISSFIFLLLNVSCGGGSSGTSTAAAPPAPAPSAAPRSPSTPNFSQVFNQVFQPYCIKCHGVAGGNRDGVNLETYANAKRRLADIKFQVDTGRMPEDQKLPANLKALIDDWVAAGGPQ
jgi:hypothetical protein